MSTTVTVLTSTQMVFLFLIAWQLTKQMRAKRKLKKQLRREMRAFLVGLELETPSSSLMHTGKH